MSNKRTKESREIGNRSRALLYDSIAWKKHAVDGIADGSRVNSIALAGLIVLRSRRRFEKPKDELAWKQGVPIRLQPLVLTQGSGARVSDHPIEATPVHSSRPVLTISWHATTTTAINHHSPFYIPAHGTPIPNPAW